MKKMIALLLCAALLLCLAACGDDSTQNRDKDSDKDKETVSTTDPTGGNGNQNGGNSNNNSGNNDATHTGVKLAGKIIMTSGYHEGYAVVYTDDSAAYCINKEGYIVFKFDEPADMNFSLYVGIAHFKNGRVFFNENIYDLQGNKTTPESVGVTKFRDYGFEGGYILAEKVTADYSSSKYEVGVMNFDYEWVVPLSEDLYNAIGGLKNVLLSDPYMYIYSNDVCYFEGSSSVNDKFLNLKTGEVSDGTDVTFDSSKWFFYQGKYRANGQGKEYLDISQHETLAYASKFVNGKAAVTFFNANQLYVTVIDESGAFQYDPVAVPGWTKTAVLEFDGNYIMIMDSNIFPSHIKCLDINGNEVGDLELRTSEYNSISISEGVIILNTRWGWADNQVHMVKPDFTPLFEQ